jgi:hypothetical protein
VAIGSSTKIVLLKENFSERALELKKPVFPFTFVCLFTWPDRIKAMGFAGTIVQRIGGTTDEGRKNLLVPELLSFLLVHGQ